MRDLRVKTSIKLDGMEKVKDLIKKQRELLEQLSRNVAEIEIAEIQLNVELATEKATE